ncbi:hypothetical protein VlAV1_gp1 [Verticillium longisporum ambiguivirus 1]|nr:hypothetical protein VlAV1_gp1 [Verticillium longisporum ambiguivirus 1]
MLALIVLFAPVFLGAVWLVWRLTILFCWFSAGVVFSCLDLLASAPFFPGDRVPALAGSVPTDRCGQPVGNVEGVAGIRQVPMTAHLCARPRRRARWVRALESTLGVVPSGTVGRLVRGRWTPDLPSVNYPPGVNLVLDRVPDGARILGGGSVAGRRKDEDVTVPYILLELSDGSVETLFPELVSVLSSYAFLRKREATLVLALRSRALDWCKSTGLSGPEAEVAVSFATKLAWVVPDRELAARETIKEEITGPWWG